MKTNYWVLKLKAFTFIKILRKFRKTDVGGLTYIEVTRPAALLIKWCQRLKVSTPPLHKIKPRESVAGPVLYLSGVRNDKGEVISLDVYHRILALRHKIMETFMDSFKTFAFFKNKKPLHAVSAYIGMLIAIDIRAAVYLAHFARWKNYKKGEEGKTKNILIIPTSQWSKYLVTHFEEILDEVIIKSNRGAGFTQGWRVFLRLVRALLRSLFTSRRSAAYSYDHKDGKILITYATGLLEAQRNDLSYYHAADIDPGRILIFFRVAKYPPSDKELAWIKQNKISCIASQSMKPSIPGIPQWKPSAILKREIKAFCWLYIKTFLQCLRKRKKHSLWFLDKLWTMGMEVAYWKDFLVQNKVSILMNPNPSEFNFIPDAAVTDIGGLAVEAERSIRFDYCTYIHNSATHIGFVTGPYSLTQIPEPSFSLVTVQTGALNVTDSPYKDKRLDELKDQGKIVVSVFDESANDVFFGESISQLYRAVIDLVTGDDRFALYIKTKKTDVLENLADINDEVKELERKSRCVLAEWKISAAAAASFSDLVVSVPSTAAFESVITGTRTIVFNPMRAGSRLFYSNNGLNRRVFEDGESMIAAIKKYADGKDDSVGDCSDIVPQIDPFRDGMGAKRIGEYLKWCLEGFDSGLEWQAIIQAANNRYTKEFGNDKVTDEHAYEKIPQTN
ncbi:MAG: hypothetical protein GTO45_00135 [Candidatus Aminicenantes bacterium]|nr:hypothetical protein [Candidatus Aminicenantes bacterium]NIM77175.1 hypothetical protein [Candidatus Aminicenantes bacterium]NIN16468.1 hypothetical protein [Candidatus Aminicenantes bacterium]NIN40329.1 hypothetical protein [Candidatus Aminicenantes bacterium]NIN83148.1 hypothetical protein [Candidatus Aminicenantes bacterium]